MISRSSYFFTLLSFVVMVPLEAQPVGCLGQVVPGERAIRVCAPPNSILGQLKVKRSAFVKKGEVLAVLQDAPLYEAQLDRTRRSLALAKVDLAKIRKGERNELVAAQEAALTKCRAEAKLLAHRHKRYAALLAEGSVSQDAYDEIASQLEALEATVRQEESKLASLKSGRTEDISKAELSVRLAEAQVREAQAALKLRVVHAPLEGEVLEIFTWPGENVGDTGAVLSIGDTSNIMILAEVYESDLARVKIGQKASIRGQAFAGEVKGEVVEIQKVMDSSHIFPINPSVSVDRRIVLVRIRPDQPKKLKHCSHAHVSVTLAVP